MPIHEPTINDVLEAVNSFATHVDQQFRDVRSEMATKKDITDIRSEMATKEDLADIRSEMATKKDLADIRSEMATKEDLTRMATKEDISDIRSEMATKDHLLRMATKEDLLELKSDLVTEIDRFVVLHQTLDVELVALRSRCERMEAFMAKVAKELKLDFQIT